MQRDQRCLTVQTVWSRQAARSPIRELPSSATSNAISSPDRASSCRTCLSIKNFSITESVKAQFQAEFFNVFNHPVYANPNTCIDCSGQGVISSLEADSQMRQLQLGVRVTF